ncbi:MAG: response regulator transcription factor, partial [Xanthomonas euvesicatoria]|nr:response regulator transcription factor [Xanthomonas euvesicatoria]
YLAKPCNPRELLARVRALLRRSQASSEQADHRGNVYEFAGWRLDVVRRDLRDPTGIFINLSDGEFALLRTFVEHPQRVLSRDQLLDYAR